MRQYFPLRQIEWRSRELSIFIFSPLEVTINSNGCINPHALQQNLQTYSQKKFKYITRSLLNIQSRAHYPIHSQSNRESKNACHTLFDLYTASPSIINQSTIQTRPQNTKKQKSSGPNNLINSKSPGCLSENFPGARSLARSCILSPPPAGILNYDDDREGGGGGSSINSPRALCGAHKTFVIYRPEREERENVEPQKDEEAGGGRSGNGHTAGAGEEVPR